MYVTGDKTNKQTNKQTKTKQKQYKKKHYPLAITSKEDNKM